MKRYASFFVLVMFCLNIRADVFSFANSRLTGWKEKSFVGNTQYQLIEQEGKTYLHAQADSTASGLFNKNQVDLRQTPFITWSCKINQVGLGNNEKSKSGDDYPVRLYVIVKGEPYFWSNCILMYVWSNQAESSSTWHNPFASEFRHMAVESGGHHVGQWREYSRNVVDDFERVFGFKPKRVDGIAIMTDGDNSKQQFEAWYGDIKFIEGGNND